MEKEIANKVNLRGLLFWKNFLQTFFLFEIMKIFSFSLISILLNDYSNGHFFEALLNSVLGMFELSVGFACSFIASYFISRRLLSDEPKSVFKYVLLKLFLFFSLAPLPLTVFAFIVAEGFFIDIGLFTFWIVTEISTILWLYLSSLWLYKSYKKTVNE